ncbi:hypothetical protein FC69_GL001189 [Latilactobacillus fuchuensis DSM 14340 = JCM 11249]|uniref:Uncharacterized protein n=1 Tax=Latilactobacillus fuchuensis DSM 14340 = JCM 11249 TaxID=1423747 RepID=A0A0R1S931_9LACO|nr:hypothetical protein FC69_GL001189 [Latilactobacillus fuchuensis DSM 14340 = JCM 11249]
MGASWVVTKRLIKRAFILIGGFGLNILLVQQLNLSNNSDKLILLMTLLVAGLIIERLLNEPTE